VSKSFIQGEPAATPFDIDLVKDRHWQARLRFVQRARSAVRVNLEGRSRTI
jgi:hypothetical protein